MLSPVKSAIRNLFWPVLALGCYSTCWTDPVFKDNEYFKLLSEINVYGFPRQPQFLFLHYWALLRKFTYKGIQNKQIFTSENQSSLHLLSTFIHHRQFTKYIIKKTFLPEGVLFIGQYPMNSQRKWSKWRISCLHVYIQPLLFMYCVKSGCLHVYIQPLLFMYCVKSGCLHVYIQPLLFMYCVKSGCLHVYIQPLLFMYCVKSGCISSSLADGLCSLTGSRHRSSKSLNGGDRPSGIGGVDWALAICRK